MPTKEEIYTIARETVVKSISNYIKKRKNKKPKFQILDLIIPTERRLRSVVGGMETSLGTTLWEPLAKAIAKTNGFEVVNANLLAPANMPAMLQNTVQTLIEGRSNKNTTYYAKFCHDRIKESCQNFIINPISDFKPAKRGFGVDIWLRKDGTDYFFDTKTVQANVGGYAKCFEQVLNWYSYYYSKFPSGNASARIVFPYNPYGEIDFWSKTIGRGWPLEPYNEGWVQDDFWDFISGIENTYSIIFQAFNSISETGDLEELIQEIFYGDGQ